MVRELIDCGANVNAAGPDGWHALHYAVSLRSANKVRALVAAGADVEAVNDRGGTALYLAAFSGDTKLVWTLVRECGAVLNRAQQQKLAFAMALNERLGQASGAHTLGPHLVSMVGQHLQDACEMAALWGHTRTEKVLRFLQALDGAAPVHAAANAERRADFTCPVCFGSLEEGLEALGLVPCGHQVCKACWARIDMDNGKCPLCREEHAYGVDVAAFLDSWPLRQRFCVEIPHAKDFSKTNVALS